MIHSWDLFDTLIGRKCGTATRLFEEMGKTLGVWDFVQRRQAAERYLQDHKVEYTLDDIYRSYSEIYGFPYWESLVNLEWKLECENVFPIVRNSTKVQKDDIIISDMYLSEDQLRQLIQIADIPFRGQILVSNYGKHTGATWEKMKGKIISHCGDNEYSDIRMAGKYGIRSRDAKTTSSTMETTYGKFSPDLKWWVRYHRLRSIVDEQNGQRLDLLQNQLNVPLLLVACNILKDYADKNNIGKLLFMSRDGQMFHRMWQKLYPDIPSQYLYISRECLRGNSTTYFNYLNSVYTENTCLVDMAASCGSLKLALPKLVNPHPRIWTMIFLPGFNVDISGIDLGYATTNIETRINNTWLEMLNYADHWHVADVRGNPIFDQADEYNMAYVHQYQKIFAGMLQDMPEMNINTPEALLRIILPKVNDEGMFLRRMFPNHLAFESNRKRKFKEYL